MTHEPRPSISAVVILYVSACCAVVCRSRTWTGSSRPTSRSPTSTSSTFSTRYPKALPHDSYTLRLQCLDESGVHEANPTHGLSVPGASLCGCRFCVGSSTCTRPACCTATSRCVGHNHITHLHTHLQCWPTLALVGASRPVLHDSLWRQSYSAHVVLYPLKWSIRARPPNALPNSR